MDSFTGLVSTISTAFLVKWEKYWNRKTRKLLVWASIQNITWVILRVERYQVNGNILDDK